MYQMPRIVLRLCVAEEKRLSFHRYILGAPHATLSQRRRALVPVVHITCRLRAAAERGDLALGEHEVAVERREILVHVRG